MTRPNGVESVTSSRVRTASSWLAGDHGRTLSQLWFVSVGLSGLNFVSTIVIVARTGATVFAEYTVALSLMTVGTALMDGGLASTFGMLAVDATAAGSRYQAFRALLAEYRLKILALGSIASLALAVFVGRNSAVFASGRWWAIVPFVAVSAAMARSSQLNSLLYARGRFGSYGVVMLAPPVLRMCLVIAVVAGFGSFTLPTLFVITLASPLFGLVWAEIAVNRETLPPDAAPVIGSSERREVAEFLAPTATSVILSGITFQLTAVGGSFYAVGPAIATYGVFMRANTIVSMLFGPTSQYVGRHLRAKGAVPSRNALENRYLLLTVLAFALYACVSLIIYDALGLRYAHYALGQTRAYAVFVFYSGLGCLQLALDGILAARGRARHRVPGTVMLCLLNAVLIPIVRPDTISSLVLIDATSMLSIVAYYWLELVLARRSLPVVQC